MTLPSKHEILLRAKAKAIEKQVLHGLPAISPTERELKESGTFQRARLDLMRVDQEALSQQMSYLQEMAGELKLKVMPIKAMGILQRETGFEWTNGWTRHERKRPIIKKPTPTKRLKRKRAPIKKKKRKRQRLHVGRNGKKPRKLKGFVFPDDVWKVRKPRKIR